MLIVTAALLAAAYAVYFVVTFILEWMPALLPRNGPNYAALLIPVVAALCAFGGLVVSARRIARSHEGPIDIIVAAGAFAFIGTFVIHGIFSDQRHVAFGWMVDAYPRYYLPVAALVPLAGLSLLAAIEPPRGAGGLPHRQPDRFPVVGRAARIDGVRTTGRTNNAPIKCDSLGRRGRATIAGR